MVFFPPDVWRTIVKDSLDMGNRAQWVRMYSSEDARGVMEQSKRGCVRAYMHNHFTPGAFNGVTSLPLLSSICLRREALDDWERRERQTKEGTFVDYAVMRNTGIFTNYTSYFMRGYRSTLYVCDVCGAWTMKAPLNRRSGHPLIPDI